MEPTIKCVHAWFTLCAMQIREEGGGSCPLCDPSPLPFSGTHGEGIEDEATTTTKTTSRDSTATENRSFCLCGRCGICRFGYIRISYERGCIREADMPIQHLDAIKKAPNSNSDLWNRLRERESAIVVGCVSNPSHNTKARYIAFTGTTVPLLNRGSLCWTQKFSRNSLGYLRGLGDVQEIEITLQAQRTISNRNGCCEEPQPRRFEFPDAPDELVGDQHACARCENVPVYSPFPPSRRCRNHSQDRVLPSAWVAAYPNTNFLTLSARLPPSVGHKVSLPLSPLHSLRTLLRAITTLYGTLPAQRDAILTTT
ncbi:unnamed protein product [Mesocestoides corti]|uniref:Uncharacterized protein n=1 Tax=Mesocestoides corti TaxID=53468 RepID=A0A0R3UP89_MESCO|nr:unnamed protein product [Mesocestoides corti]